MIKRPRILVNAALWAEDESSPYVRNAPRTIAAWGRQRHADGSPNTSFDVLAATSANLKDFIPDMFRTHARNFDIDTRLHQVTLDEGCTNNSAAAQRLYPFVDGDLSGQYMATLMADFGDVPDDHCYDAMTRHMLASGCDIVYADFKLFWGDQPDDNARPYFSTKDDFASIRNFENNHLQNALAYSNTLVKPDVFRKASYQDHAQMPRAVDAYLDILMFGRALALGAKADMAPGAIVHYSQGHNLSGITDISPAGITRALKCVRALLELMPQPDWPEYCREVFYEARAQFDHLADDEAYAIWASDQAQSIKNPLFLETIARPPDHLVLKSNRDHNAPLGLEHG